MYDQLLKNKIDDALKSHKIVAKTLKWLGNGNELINILKKEIDSFLMDNDEIYKFSNFKNLIYKSFIDMDSNRFANFIMNVVNENPDKNRTYKHLLNDIQSQLKEKYNLPDDYYHMSRTQLDHICDELLVKEDYFILHKTREFIKDNFRIFDYNSYIKENKDLALKILRRNNIDETNRTFLRIKKMLENHVGYLGLFTYFHFIEKITFVRLKILFKNLIDNKNILRNLPMGVTDYMQQKPPYTIDGRTYTSNFERLEDDLTLIMDEHKAKLFANEYPSHLRRNLHKNSDFIEIVRELTAETDEARQKLEFYKNIFIKKVSRYKSQQELINALIDFVYSSMKNQDIEDLCKYNPNLKIVFDNGELTIVRVLDFESLETIAPDTNWCIRTSLSYWENYVGDDNVQLVIINSDKPTTSVERKIGVTLNPDMYDYKTGSYRYSFRTAHYRNDNFVSETTVEKILKEHGTDLDTIFNVAQNIGTNKHYSQYDVDESENERYNRY